MDNQRLFLFVALSFVLMLIWQAWLTDYGAKPAPTATEQAQTGTPATSAAPSQDVPAGTVSSAAPAAPAVAAAQAAATGGQRIRIITDVLDLQLDSRGGDVHTADLLAYPKVAGKSDEPFRLMDDAAADLFIPQSGLLAPGAPDHHALYSTDKTEYRLADGAQELEVRLHWRNAEGLKVDKVYSLKRGSYAITVRYEVENGGTQTWKGRAYEQLQHGEPAKAGRFGISTYTGGVIYSPDEKYKKISFDNIAKQDLSRDFSGGWAAMIQHYFLGAWIPETTQTNHYFSKALPDKHYVLGLVSPEISVAPQGKGVFTSRLYVGPKLQDHLAQVAPGLELTVDYGVLTFIAQPIFWLLKNIHKIVGNWGWAIILLTMLIKLAFYKLSETSYRSMANMRKLQPRMQALKERYGDDRQKLNTAMMEMYKKEKINPLGGCLPIVVQIPVFLSLYWVLLETVEMRQAPWILWIKDMSSADPYFILPLIMGVTMLLQQKLNPAPIDPMQAKVMMAMPFLFTVFFAFFPSGLVLYWVVNNTLSIAQQWVITKRVAGNTL
jgi:YidC/Oxa1 family membrane protein insertase